MAVSGVVTYPQRGMVEVTYSSVTGQTTVINLSRYTDRSVHVRGSVTGATVYIQGSMVSATGFSTLRDTASGTMVFPSGQVPGMNQVRENATYMRAVVSGAGAATSVNIVFVGRRDQE